MLSLATERLFLTLHQPENLALIHQWQNDPEILSYNTETVRLQSNAETVAQLKRWIDSGETSSTRHLAIHLNATGTLVGFAQVAFIDLEHRRCKLGITIGEKTLWGTGLGAEALEALVHYCFVSLQLNRITAEVFAFNHRAIRLFERHGFQREGVLRQNIMREGYIDEYVYGLLSSEWMGHSS